MRHKRNLKVMAAALAVEKKAGKNFSDLPSTST